MGIRDIAQSYERPNRGDSDSGYVAQIRSLRTGEWITVDEYPMPITLAAYEASAVANHAGFMRGRDVRVLERPKGGR